MTTSHSAITEEKAFHILERLEALATEEEISPEKLVEYCRVILRRKDDIARLTSGAQSVSVAQLLHCSFCFKPQTAVKLIITGEGVCICDECVEVCNCVIREEQGT
ncbi:carboxylate--amine ligase [Escherichia coli]|uniref:ClpX C4-type zinc finger protein n=1 Tax=Escherichia coli TaxID=562 RepID=UPI000D6A3E07|nr:ClpX C4-type zinc finger protein [Escherichia coli]EIS6464754.1 carboxylate--amine ligase [Escherichia coli]EKI3095217.1 carboxylate--amine ligase [Escherichia coli]MED9497965.1 ClpX C4-type zinc finger protein [Escherichia marmotae]HAM4850808.1 carboxylate--amine ligase [Escherichia coli]